VQSPAPPATDTATIAARLAVREERIKLLEEENCWLKAQLFGRSSEKSPAAEVSPDQRRLFNEAEALAQASQSALIPAHERKKRGCKPLSADLPRVEVLHDLADHEKIYCPCCRQGVQIAPTPLALFPKSLATPALLAHIVTAKFVDGLPLYRQEAQFARLGVTLGRATMAGWMIRLGGTHLVPLINLLNEQMLEHPLIHSGVHELQFRRDDGIGLIAARDRQGQRRRTSRLSVAPLRAAPAPDDRRGLRSDAALEPQTVIAPYRTARRRPPERGYLMAYAAVSRNGCATAELIALAGGGA
jgi:transposase